MDGALCILQLEIVSTPGFFFVVVVVTLGALCNRFLSFLGHVEMVRLLLQLGADVNLADKVGNQPIHAASLGGVAEILRIFVEEYRVYVGAEGQYKRTPLHITSERGKC
jgi:ankyrin repeat protein